MVWLTPCLYVGPEELRGILSVFASCCVSLFSLPCLDSRPSLMCAFLWKNTIDQSALMYLYCAYCPTRWMQCKYSCTGYQNNFVPLIFCKSKRRHKSSQMSSSSQNNRSNSSNNKTLESWDNFDYAVYLNFSLKFSKAYQSHWVFWLVKGLTCRLPPKLGMFSREEF